jgi:ABC-type sugar transport systems, permease components
MKTFSRYPLYFIVPAFLLYAVLFIYPTAAGFYYSFTDWSSYSKEINFIGMENFSRLFTEGVMQTAIRNTLIFAVAVTVLVNVVGLTLALMLNERTLLGSFYRTAFFIPVVIASIIVGYIFMAILNPEYGILNKTLRAIGLDALAMNWLPDTRTALWSIIGTEVWKSAGFAMIIYLSGLKTIPRDLIEQAMVDGAHYLTRFRHIVFPLLAPAFTVNFLLTVIGSLKVFEIVFVLTGGGPGYATEVINTFVYRNFAKGMWGYATSASIMLTLIVSVVAVSLLIVLRKREIEL